ncbi:uncharacterized protein LOC134181436 isoform X2 [Corticium candelabrum]|uniref:uncharacterized protein LOC134181436 isoform X2 n=1 Tax=Corticium candelabrum TaxID=121492 RepID=UPI002E276647|nr:uncharacterized protein LOC134181436 isoform X2 [Corticium candelabrum]
MRIKCLLYLCVCIPIVYCAVGDAWLGICYMGTSARKTTFEQMQGIHQVREAFTKSLNILLFYSNCDEGIFEVLRGLGGTCGMKIDEETIDEKATMLKLIARKAYTWRDYAIAKDLFCMQMEVEAATMVLHAARHRFVSDASLTVG